MAGPGRSLVKWLDGERKEFSTYEDLVGFLVSQGVVPDETDLVRERSDLLQHVFLQWVRGGQLGCLFASHLAKNPAEVDWESISVTDSFDPRLPWHLEATLRHVSPSWHAVQLILPGLTTGEDVARVLGNFCRHPDWDWIEIPWQDCRNDGCFLCGIRWRVPDQGRWSWVLGFGPLDSLPFTRRIVGAPFSVLVMRTRNDPYSDRFPAPDAGTVHLAEMPSVLPSKSTKVDDPVGVDRRREARTARHRLQMLGDECGEAAKAKVTFCLPEDVRRFLGEPGSS